MNDKEYGKSLDRFKFIIENMEGNEIVLLDGKFGTGKTYFLEEYKKKLPATTKQIITTNLYNEYLEEDYIDYLYKLLYSKKNWIQKLLHLMRKYWVQILFFSIFIVFFLMLHFFTEVNSYNTMILLLINIFLFISTIFKGLLINDKINKKNYIESQFKKIDLFIIEDMDRCYIDNKEILKMIDFLINQNSKTKYILVGDWKVLTIGDNNVFEKFTTYNFSIPTNINLNIMKNELKNIIIITDQYGMDVRDAFINIITSENYTFRTHKKIIKKIELEKDSFNKCVVFQKIFMVYLYFYRYELYIIIRNIYIELNMNFYILENVKKQIIKNFIEKLEREKLSKKEINFIRKYILNVNTNDLNQINFNFTHRYDPIFTNFNLYDMEYKENEQLDLLELRASYKTVIEDDLFLFTNNFERDLGFYVENKENSTEALINKFTNKSNLEEKIKTVHCLIYINFPDYISHFDYYLNKEAEKIFNSFISEDLKIIFINRFVKKDKEKMIKLINFDDTISGIIKIIFCNMKLEYDLELNFEEKNFLSGIDDSQSIGFLEAVKYTSRFDDKETLHFAYYTIYFDVQVKEKIFNNVIKLYKKNLINNINLEYDLICRNIELSNDEEKQTIEIFKNYYMSNDLIKYEEEKKFFIEKKKMKANIDA